ncbi:MAG: T9SS type A sorting domain-containing protein [Candidatus Hatepunaea meridiana]|nr:T9SS type A sorting domain-containing protein [Candidatus Hatepunaea meridiana]
MNKHLRHYRLLVFIFVIILATTTGLQAGLQYFSNYQTSGWDEPVPLLSDTFNGDVHVNEYIYLRYPVRFNGIVSTSQNRFIWQGVIRDSVHFRYDPLFNMPLGFMPRYAEEARRYAHPRISSQDGRYMTRVWLRDDCITIYQYEMGSEPPPLYGDLGDVYNVQTIHSFWRRIFIDGQAEIYGRFNGNATIVTSDDMWLVDDIWYIGTNRENGEGNAAFRNKLGLISEQDIIIKNNSYNGRNNGYHRYGEHDIEHHSITITAALCALGGSFKIEQTNFEWEPYQGPSPDERGTIHLRGMLVQWRASPLHFRNHGGTGYTVDFQYDENLDIFLPPFFYCPIQFIQGDIRYYTIKNLGIIAENAECCYLTALPGAHLEFLSFDTLTISSKFDIFGTVANPVFIRWHERPVISPPAKIVMNWERGGWPDAEMRNAVFENGIQLNFDADTILIDSCRFADEVILRGRYVQIKNSTFSEGVTLNGWGNIVFDHNLVEGTLIVDGNPRSINIINNTIINPDGDGIFLDSYRSAELNSNIIAYCERGIVKDNWHDVELIYNNVYSNRDGDYIDCEPGEASISLNPCFIDIEEGDYQLSWNSTCINAGDPDLPHDPDGSRADIGAFYRDRGLSAFEEMVELPETCSITASPNPFNSSCTISFQVRLTREFQIKIYDLSGREVFSDRLFASSIDATYTIKGSQLGGAGIYFVRLITGNKQETLKIIYLP